MDILTHYLQSEVREEIFEFLKGRWVAIEGDGKRWIRWWGNKPLTLKDPSDIINIFKENTYLRPRSIYGTIEIFERLESKEDVDDRYDFNVIKVTPFIDIDIIDESLVERAWIYVIEVAKTIVNYLCDEENVCKSVYVLWTGAGAHVRINENSFSQDLLTEDHPINIAFAVVEYVLRRTLDKVKQILKESNGVVKVENIVSQKRVFTAPLSIHRKLDRVAIALSLEDLDMFTLSWTEVNFYKHNIRAWREFEIGEADELARKALKMLRGDKRRTKVELAKWTKKEIVKGKIGRFPVMALLQAARYYLITGDLDRAKSFGLNRAIFYAWAKYYGPSRSASAKLSKISEQKGRSFEKPSSDIEWAEILGEKVKVSRNGWFIMGNVEQTPRDFDRNVTRKFEEAGMKFEEAWEAALDYVSKFPRAVLENSQRFFKEVYEPVRDNFVEKVLNNKWEPRPRFNFHYNKKNNAERTAKRRKPMGLDRWLR